MKQEFSKYQLWGAVLTCFIVLLCVVLFALMPHQLSTVNYQLSTTYNNLQERIDSFNNSLQEQRFTHYQTYVRKDTISLYLHEFDPNTADSIELRQVGFSAWQARNILKYRAKGGKYKNVEALKKVYGMTDELYAQIAPFVVIDTTIFMIPQDTLPRPIYVSNKKDTVLDLNHCDTTELQMIRGIGPVYAARIVRYREQLGGYYSPQQLLEVEGLQTQDSVFLQHFTANPIDIQRISINHIKADKLSRHPYLRFEQAQAIYENRRRHGDYSSLEDLQETEILDSLTFVKIQPYLNFE